MTERKTSLFDGKGTIGERRAALRKAAVFLAPGDLRLLAQVERQPELLATFEGPLLKAAQERAHNSGRLVSHVHRDRAGREIEVYEGDMNAWLSSFKHAGMAVRVLREPADTRVEHVKLKPGQRVRIVDAGSD